MANEDLFMDVAKSCVRTCHVLKTMTEGTGVDDLSGPSKEIEALERCADPGRFFLLTMTSDARTVRHIESTIREHADCARDLCEDHPGSATECLAAWRTEMLEKLRALDVCDFHLTIPTPSEPPQVGLRQGGVLEVDEIRQHVQGPIDTEPTAPALIIVRCFVISAPCSPLTVYST